MKLKIISRSPEETLNLGEHLGKAAKPGDIFLLSGNLGAGKTCLTQGIVWGLGSHEYALSPTFVLMREISGRLTVYHIDLYRLERLEEITDIGLDDYLYGKGLCVIEWAEKGRGIFPAEHLQINIGYRSDNERIFEFNPRGKRYQELVKGLQTANMGLK